jgi:hypothetical protein
LAREIGNLLSTIQAAGNLAVQTVSLPGGQFSMPVGTSGAIGQLYKGILDRPADAGGLQFWTNSGLTLAAVADSLIASSEYAQRYGSLSNMAFVNQLYENMFSRPADASGLQFWVGQLAAGADRGSVAAEIANSSEAQTGFDVTPTANNNAEMYRLYQVAFGRAPDGAGEAYWTSLLANGWTVEQVAAALVQSAEFQTDNGALTPEQFIDRMYFNAFGYHSSEDPNGAAWWVNQMTAGGLTQAQVLVGFSDSAESVTKYGGSTNELVLAGPGGMSMTVPGSYSYVIQNDATADTLTASNAAIVTNTVGGTYFLSGNSTVAATGGNSTVNATGTYDLSFGAGNNLINVSGSGIISTGPNGASTVLASNTSGPGNVINLYGTGDVVDATYGSNMVNAAGTNSTISGGFGALSVSVGGADGQSGDVVQGGFGPLTFVGGTAGSTVFGSSGGSTVTSGTNLVFNANGLSNSVDGTGPSTIFGTSNTSVTFTGSNALTYSAASGNATLNATGTTASVTVASLGGAASVSTGAGNDSITVGYGNETLNAGGGANNYFFTAGQTSGATDYINDSFANLVTAGNDTFTFTNYTSNSQNWSATNGAATLTLADNTKIIFVNVSATLPNEAALVGHFNVVTPV